MKKAFMAAEILAKMAMLVGAVERMFAEAVRGMSEARAGRPKAHVPAGVGRNG
jgi:hypothetical protein